MKNVNIYNVKEFKFFLRKHRAWRKYKQAFKHGDQYQRSLRYQQYRNIQIVIYVFLKERRFSTYISGAFVWEDTKEGFDFWNDLSNDWKSYYNSLHDPWGSLGNNGDSLRSF